MPITLRDIADQLGLSPAVVSRVLNNKPGGWASESTRRRILDAARDLNYLPSAAARALVTGRTMQLAFSSADADLLKVGRDRMGEVVGFIHAATTAHYRVLVLTSPEQRANPQQFDALVQSAICDGVCLYAEQAGPELYGLLRTSGTPFVVVGNPGERSLPQVDHDNYGYAYSSTAWLYEQGHRRIAFAYHSPGDSPFMRELQNGYCDAMKELCGDHCPTWIPARRMDQAAREAFLTGRDAPTALILCGVRDGLQWRASSQAAGLRVPEDVTFLIHTDPSELGYLQPGDAYHIHDPFQVGMRAGELLIDWIGGAPPPDEPVLISTPGARWYTASEPGRPAEWEPRP